MAHKPLVEESVPRLSSGTSLPSGAWCLLDMTFDSWCFVGDAELWLC